MAKKKKKKKEEIKSNISKKRNTKKKNSTKSKSSVSKNTSRSSTSKKGGSKNSTKKQTSKVSNTNKKVSTKNNKVKNNNNGISSKKSVEIKSKPKNGKFKLFLGTIIVLSILLVVFFGYLLINDNKDVESVFSSIDLNKYLELYNSEELEFIYLYHDSCVNCNSYEVNLKKIESEQGIVIKKFDYSKLNDEDLNTLKSSNTSFLNGIAVPILISIKGGEEVDSISGIKEYSALKNFVITSQNPLDVKSFNKIKVNDYISLLESKNKSFIYICNPNEKGCETFTPTLVKVSKNRKLKVNYLDTDTIISASDWDKLEESSKVFDDMWFMPALLVVKDGKVIDYKMEILSENDLIKFLKKNGL